MADGLEAIRREFRTFGRYLVGRDPGAAALSYYESWHEAHGNAEAERAPRIDRALVALARMHPLAARVADTYAARLRRASLLRRKLVLVLALIECSPDTWRLVESPGPGGRVRAYVRLVSGACCEALTLLVGAVLLLPVHGVLLLLPDRGAKT